MAECLGNEAPRAEAREVDRETETERILPGEVGGGGKADVGNETARGPCLRCGAALRVIHAE